MNRNGLITWLFVIVAVPANDARADPVSLASFDFTVDTQIPRTDQIGFVLQFLDADNNFLFIGPAVGGLTNDVRLGPSLFWKSGETGDLEFNESNTEDFSIFTELLTDGVDDSLLVFWRWERDGGFEGGGRLESETFGLPGLFGNAIRQIRMSVNEVFISPVDPFVSDVRVNVTYEFEGNVIPEPSTVALLLVGLFTMLRKKCRIPKESDK
jgi:hypothetical protein